MPIINFFITRPLVVNIISIMILGMGVMGLMEMQREAFPSVNFDYVAISTVYPGASPEEIETLVTEPIEKEITGINGVIEVKSNSIEGFSSIVVKLDPDATEKVNSKATDDLIRAVQRVKNLPIDLPNPPLVTEIASDRWPIIEIALSSESMSEIELKNLAEEISFRLEDISDISIVNERGAREKEYWIQIDQDKVVQYDLSYANIVASLRMQNLDLPGGALDTKEGEYLVRTIGRKNTPEELGEVVIRANDSGQTLKIKDIATVQERLEQSSILHRADGHNGIILQVIKSAEGDVINLVDKVKLSVKNYLAEAKLTDKVNVGYVNDISFFVRNRLGVLQSNGIYGFIFVAVILLLFLSPGIALVTAIGMPIAIFGAFIVLGYMGMTINLLSMFGLIIVIGILVDDAIIVAENIWHHYELGLPPLEATIKGTSEVILPVAATITTTCAAFSPLLMMSGVFGQFIKEMPIVVIAALCASWFEAMFILPSHAYDVLRYTEKKRIRLGKPKINATKEGEEKSKVVNAYARLLHKTLYHRYIFITGISAFTVLTLIFAATMMKFTLFPADGIEQFFVRTDLPLGTSIEETLEEMKSVEAVIRTLPEDELRNFVTTVGIQQNDNNDPFTARGKHLGEIKVYLAPDNLRKRSTDAIIKELETKMQALIGKSKHTGFRYARVQNGPPVGKPVSLQVVGKNLAEINTISEEVIAKLKGNEQLVNIESDYRLGKKEFRIEVDQSKLMRALLTTEGVATHIRAALDGLVSGYVTNNGEQFPVRVILDSEGKNSLELLENMQIPNQMNNLVRLKSVASFSEEKGIDGIKHLDRRRTITVNADLKDASVYTSNDANADLLPIIKELQSKYPHIKFAQGGEFEDTKNSMDSLLKAFLVAAALIFFILVLQFGNMTQPFMVMSAIPFGVVGVIWAMFFHGLPLSFLCMIGTIGLCGVVVNDSIVLVAYMNSVRSEGASAFDAAYQAGIRRFRPVWLTTLTTVVGLLPMVYGIGGFDKFLQPAAIALGYGLIFGTILVLFMVPAISLVREDILARGRQIRGNQVE